jgi:hypothetical protein
MARATVNRGLDSETAQQVMSRAVGAAEALVMGVGDVAERAIAETARAAEDVGTEIGAALARAARGSVRARESGGDLVHSGRTVSRRIMELAGDVATSADGRVPKAVAKARGRRRRRRGLA